MTTIQTRYILPNKNFGTRIQARSSGGRVLVENYDYKLTIEQNHLLVAGKLKLANGWDGGMYKEELPYGYIFVVHEVKQVETNQKGTI